MTSSFGADRGPSARKYVRLSELNAGEQCLVHEIAKPVDPENLNEVQDISDLRIRLMEMGLVGNTVCKVIRRHFTFQFLHLDVIPMTIDVRGTRLSLRREDAEKIRVVKIPRSMRVYSR